MTTKLVGVARVVGILLCLLFAATARADVTNSYCTTFDPATNTLDVPCLIYDGDAYSASLQLTSSVPITLQLTGVAASGLASVPGKCATFNSANSTASIPCIVFNGTRFWGVFDVAMGSNVVVTLSKASGGVPANCTPLTQPPAGVTVVVIPTGEVTGHIANTYVNNNSGQQRCFCAEPRMGLHNSAPGSQNMVLIRTSMLCIPDGAQAAIAVHGSCANIHLAVPSANERFTFFEDARVDLIALTQTIERESPVDYISAIAIWAITDSEPVDTYSVSQVRALFQQAGLDQNAYPALRSQ